MIAPAAAPVATWSETITLRSSRMLPRMSIGNWFKKLFSSSGGSESSEDFAAEAREIDINDARINAGGSGLMGIAQHESPGEETARYESD